MIGHTELVLNKSKEQLDDISVDQILKALMEDTSLSDVEDCLEMINKEMEEQSLLFEEGPCE